MGFASERRGLLALWLVVALAGCGRETTEITFPKRGQMITGSDTVTITGRSEADSLSVAGKKASVKNGKFRVTVPAAQGMGFVATSGSELDAVRAWHQGTFIPATDMVPESVTVQLGPDALSAPTDSLAAVLATLLQRSQLAVLLDNPFATSALGLSLDVWVTSAIAEDVTVSLVPDAGALALDVTLHNLRAAFTTDSPCVQVAGTVTYPTVTLSGNLTLTSSAATLSDASVVFATPSFAVDTALPLDVVEAVSAEMQGALEQAVADSAANAASEVSRELLASLQPRIAGELAATLTQEATLESLTVDANGLALRFATSLQAVSPLVARDDQGILQSASTAALSAGSGLAAKIDSQLVDQLAFALWDAGQLEGLHFTKAELEAAGMPSLDFPYSKLRSVDVTALLPPLLRFTADGAVLDVGGIRADLDVATVPDTTAWAAARIPVVLAQAEGALRLEVDPTRETEVLGIEFSDLNDLASVSKAKRLFRSAVPVAVMSIFGDLATIALPSFSLALPDGGTGPTVGLSVQGITRLTDAWQLDLALEVTPVGTPAPALTGPTAPTGVCPSAFSNTLSITAPARATMISGTADVAVALSTDATSAALDGVPVSLDASGAGSSTVTAADGLGFVVATAGDRTAVRSWHQGSFLSPTDWHSDTVDITLPAAALNTGSGSLAGLVDTVLTNGDLSPYTDPIVSDITVTLPIIGSTTVPVTTTVTAASSPTVEVTMVAQSGGIAVTVTLHNLLAHYTAVAANVINATGTVFYDTVTVEGILVLDPSGATLTSSSVTTSDPVFTGLPSTGASVVMADLRTAMDQAILGAAENVTESVASAFLAELRPELRLDFPEPISQDSRAQSVSVSTAGVALTYDTLIGAVTPAVATPSQGVLERLVSATPAFGTQLEVLSGSPLVNDLAFAVWDAGNLSAIDVTPAQLAAAGMPALGFPYDLVSGVTLDLLLPPLLAWDGEGPWLDVGGVAATIEVAGAPPTHLWTAVRVPVRLEAADASGESLVLLSDPSRAITPRAVELEDLNPLANPDDVLALINAAVPAAVDAVFGSLPVVHLPAFTLQGLSGAASPSVRSRVLDVMVEPDAWRLEVELTRL